jgi:hypothetical protein
MDPMTLAALSSLVKPVLGAVQTGFGFGMKQPDRPKFDIPDSAEAALANAESQALLNRLPGQSAIEGRLDRVTANTLNTLERVGDSPVSNINAASRAYGNQLDRETELGIKGAEMQLANQNILRSEQNKMAQWENQQFKFDEVDPYMTKMAQISALKGAGLTNLTGGLQDILGVLSKFGLATPATDAATDGDASKSGLVPALGDLPSGIYGSNPSFETGSETPEERRLIELLNFGGFE